MSSSFAALGVPAPMVAALTARGITAPFPIQASAVPPGLSGRDIAGRAPTGSGKTLAFGLPLAARMAVARKPKPTRPRALVLAPTRELASQIHDELHTLLRPHGRTVAAFYGGVSFTPQLKALRRGVDVAVACPGRLADLIRRGNVVLDEVEVVVVDEADRMADMGFLPEVRRILDQVKPDRQTLLFSATLDGDVAVLIERYQRDPVRCDVIPDERVPDLTKHVFVRAAREERVRTTAALVAEHGSTIVFCRTKHGADRLARQLAQAGVAAVAIHGGRSQVQRQRALAAFAAGHATALVATDVAARGIHVDGVECVVHFDVAADPKDYVHRSGRTGRAGARGVVVSLVGDADAGKVRAIRSAMGLQSEGRPVPARAATPSRPAGPARSRRQGRRSTPASAKRSSNAARWSA